MSCVHNGHLVDNEGFCLNGGKVVRSFEPPRNEGPDHWEWKDTPAMAIPCVGSSAPTGQFVANAPSLEKIGKCPDCAAKAAEIERLKEIINSLIACLDNGDYHNDVVRNIAIEAVERLE